MDMTGTSAVVIPAQAGIHLDVVEMDARFRRHDVK
jgi:hypothetical protein